MGKKVKYRESKVMEVRKIEGGKGGTVGEVLGREGGMSWLGQELQDGEEDRSGCGEEPLSPRGMTLK